MSKYTCLLNELEDAWRDGERRARRGDSRDAFYTLCTHGQWLNAACLAGYDTALDEIRAQRELLDRVAPRTPLPPPPRCTSRATLIGQTVSGHGTITPGVNGPRCVLPQGHDDWHSNGAQPAMRWTEVQ